MPDHLVLKLLHFVWSVYQAHASVLRIFEGQPLWKGQNHVGLRNRASCYGEKWNDKSHSPLLREGSQRSIDRCLFAGQHAHNNMRKGQVLVE